MQHTSASVPGTVGFQQVAPQHVVDCQSLHVSVDNRPPLSVEQGYHPGTWSDPVTVQCPVHGRYQPFVPGFHQTVCSTDHLHLSHPHQFICHHQQPQQPLTHIYQSSYAVQSPPLINQSQYTYGPLPASGVSVDVAGTSRGDWCHPCVEFQHQPDCQLIAQSVTSAVMQQQHNVSSVGLAQTDVDDASNERLELSIQSADNADLPMMMTAHHGQLTPAASAATTCNTGEVLNCMQKPKPSSCA